MNNIQIFVKIVINHSIGFRYKQFESGDRDGQCIYTLNNVPIDNPGVDMINVDDNNIL